MDELTKSNLLFDQTATINYRWNRKL